MKTKQIQHGSGTQSSARNIVFFDAECLFCNGSVQLLLQLDRKKSIYFAPIRGNTWNVVLGNEGIETDSIVFWNGRRYFLRSAAVLNILRSLGGIWTLAAVTGRIIPEKLFNILYDYIARNRYRWFGRTDQCIIPPPEDRVRFLD